MNLAYQVKYLTGLLKRYGVRGLVLKVLERRKSPMLAYGTCYGRYLPTEAELRAQRGAKFPYQPLISIVVPAYETPRQYLCELLDSVLAQSYAGFELCIADGSKTDAVGSVVAEYAKGDARVRYQKLSVNGGISENTNAGFAMAQGDYIALMDHDDLLSPNALYEMVKCLNEFYGEQDRSLAMIYSDEDKINGDGTVYSRPHFKPDYNLEFLRRNNYFCHFLLFSAELPKKAGGLRKEYDGAQDYDLVLRYVDAGAVIRHVPKILYHWRIHEGSTAGNSEDKAYAFDNGCKAITAHLERNHLSAGVSVTENLGVYRVKYDLEGEYGITVVAGDEAGLRRIRSHYEKLSYEGKPYRLRIWYRVEASLRREIVQACEGEYLFSIRKGIEAKPEGLLEGLLGICQQKQVGAVGAKLLTPKKRVASCGFLYDEKGNLIPSCGGIYAGYKGYFLHSVIPQNVSVISFDCAMLRLDAVERIGGMEQSFAGIYRDADDCFRLREHGYAVAVTPEMTAVYKNTRNEYLDNESRQAFFEKWEAKLREPDPCYNRNLSLEKNHTYAMKP